MFYAQYLPNGRVREDPAAQLDLESHALAAVVGSDWDVLAGLDDIAAAIFHELENIGAFQPTEEVAVRRFLQENGRGLRAALEVARSGHVEPTELLQPDLDSLESIIGPSALEEWRRAWADMSLPASLAESA